MNASKLKEILNMEMAKVQQLSFYVGIEKYRKTLHVVMELLAQKVIEKPLCIKYSSN